MTPEMWARRARRGGAAEVAADVSWVQVSVLMLEEMTKLRGPRWCAHLSVNEAGVVDASTGAAAVGLVPTSGSRAFEVLCSVCEAAEERPWCQVCRVGGRGVRPVFSAPRPGSALVLTGRMCGPCRVSRLGVRP